jgi:hypothetical protein
LARKSAQELRSHRWYRAKDLRSVGHRSRTAQMGLDSADYRGKVMIAIINTWSDIDPCHTHTKQRVKEVKRGVWAAGGFLVEMPAMSLSEPFRKPTTMLYRNLLAMEAEELLRSYPANGTVLMGGVTRPPGAPHGGGVDGSCRPGRCCAGTGTARCWSRSRTPGSTGRTCVRGRPPLKYALPAWRLLEGPASQWRRRSGRKRSHSVSSVRLVTTVGGPGC